VKILGFLGFYKWLSAPEFGVADIVNGKSQGNTGLFLLCGAMKLRCSARYDVLFEIGREGVLLRLVGRRALGVHRSVLARLRLFLHEIRAAGG